MVEIGIVTRILGDVRGPAEERLYDVQVCSVDGGPVLTNSGFTLQPTRDGTALTWADTVVVPAADSEDILSGRLDPAVGAALGAIRPGTRVVSVCTGAFVLAAAGLLDGRPATTHWKYSRRFARLFPQVALDVDVLYVDDGDILTSAGNFAGVDLCLHLLRRDFGGAVAAAMARRCVVAPWRDGGQSQFVDRPVPDPADASTTAVRAWATKHLDEEIDIATMAATAGMSARTFTRHFRAETGISPGQWLTRARIERARHLLESSPLSIDQVAARCGFGTPVSFRQHMRATVGLSPSAYRRRFAERSA